MEIKYKQSKGLCNELIIELITFSLQLINILIFVRRKKKKGSCKVEKNKNKIKAL